MARRHRSACRSRTFAAVPVEDEGQGRAAAGRAFELHEGERIAMREELDRADRDGVVADGADNAVETGADAVQRIHSCGVYRPSGRDARIGPPLRRILPPSIIGGTTCRRKRPSSPRRDARTIQEHQIHS
jgi:hypothetical protein